LNPGLKYAVMVAGGTGSRMVSGTPKQFMSLAGRPVLMHAITAFVHTIPSIRIILVLPPDYFSYWKALAARHHFDIEHQQVEGGEQRFHSVKNGLEIIPEDALVAIHDGVRPFIGKSLIEEAFQCAQQYGSAIPCIALNESVRRIEGDNSRPFPRDLLRIVQTPQVFHARLIKNAYKQDFQESFTDDATVLENSGLPVHLIQGDPLNIKITYPEDLIMAEAIMKRVGS
jgi:2-C-methyl-D-erythritol 4-phosphate cytidylyltransferase